MSFLGRCPRTFSQCRYAYLYQMAETWYFASFFVPWLHSPWSVQVEMSLDNPKTRQNSLFDKGRPECEHLWELCTWLHFLSKRMSAEGQQCHSLQIQKIKINTIVFILYLLLNILIMKYAYLPMNVVWGGYIRSASLMTASKSFRSLSLSSPSSFPFVSASISCISVRTRSCTSPFLVRRYVMKASPALIVSNPASKNKTEFATIMSLDNFPELNIVFNKSDDEFRVIAGRSFLSSTARIPKSQSSECPAFLKQAWNFSSWMRRGWRIQLNSGQQRNNFKINVPVDLENSCSTADFNASFGFLWISASLCQIQSCQSNPRSDFETTCRNWHYHLVKFVAWTLVWASQFPNTLTWGLLVIILCLKWLARVSSPELPNYQAFLPVSDLDWCPLEHGAAG